MYITYVDEAGCTGALPSATSNIQPVFSLLALTIRSDRVEQLTRDFVVLKRRFFPASHPVGWPLDAILSEVKGADLRREFRTGNRSQVRHHLLFLGRLLRLVEDLEGRIFGRIYVKPIAGRFDGQAVYTSAIQSLCSVFQHFLTEENDQGVMIADSRYPGLNAQVSHSIFTEKFRLAGDKYPSLLEMPVFGHSENHAGIQVCDLITSAIVFPLACHVYCTGYVTNTHVHANYSVLKTWFGSTLKRLQYRYQDRADNRWKGGLTVADALGHQSSSTLF